MEPRPFCQSLASFQVRSSIVDLAGGGWDSDEPWPIPGNFTYCIDNAKKMRVSQQ